MRLGYHAREGYLDNALALQGGGISELFVHGRSKEDGYKPPAYWGAIGEIQQGLHIPVIANGEIWTPDDALQCLQESGCKDIMIGRGLLARPDLARAIKAKIAGENYDYLSWQQLLPSIWQYHCQTLETYPAKYAGNRLKQWLMYLIRTYPEAQQLFDAIKREREAEAMAATYQQYCLQLTAKQIDCRQM
jgi:tRNA-dihydrouridine synthase C